jgi:hypothetical protein
LQVFLAGLLLCGQLCEQITRKKDNEKGKKTLRCLVKLDYDLNNVILHTNLSHYFKKTKV